MSQHGRNDEDAIEPATKAEDDHVKVSAADACATPDSTSSGDTLLVWTGNGKGAGWSPRGKDTSGASPEARAIVAAVMKRCQRLRT
jgi:hypothetical protein